MSGNFIAGLNPEQQQAVVSPGHALVIACPGSGKTAMLSAKAAYLLSRNKRVVAVTFTKDAAHELRERIVKKVGHDRKDMFRRLWVGTFHSAGLAIASPARLAKGSFGTDMLSEMMKAKKGTDDSSSIMDEHQRLILINRILKDCGGANDEGIVDRDAVNEALVYIESVKAGDITCAEGDQSTHAKMYRAYAAYMRSKKSIDFQDIILGSLEAMKTGASMPFPTDHLLVDEFQDTDKQQLEIVLMHRSRSVITVVGDDDQSIYGWRRALGMKGMEQFAAAVGAEKIVMGTNYRCRAEILEHAGYLISVNRARMDKRLFAAKGKGGFAAWEAFGNTELESEAILFEAQRAIRDKATMAVITRNNRALMNVEALLRAYGVPYTTSTSILTTQEFALLSSLMVAVAAKSHKIPEMALGAAGVSHKGMTALASLFGGKFDDRKNISKDFDIDKADVDKYRELRRRYLDWCDQYDPVAQVNSLVARGIFTWVNEFCGGTMNLGIVDAMEGLLVPSGGRGQDFNETIKSLKNSMDRDPADKSLKVALMTAHSSKGLEFDRVWIAQCRDGGFPSKGDPSEERRLMYVAMTRAREWLMVSHAGNISKISPYIGDREASETKLRRAPEGRYKITPDRPLAVARKT